MDDPLDQQILEKLPFIYDKVPVCYGIEDVETILEKYPSLYVCLYLANKDDNAWEHSTSRVYMNQVLPGLMYIPVNIQGRDDSQLQNVYQFAIEQMQVVAINHTSPHKNNPVLRELFCDTKDTSEQVDVLLKNEAGEFKPYDLNGPSFVDAFLYDEDLGTFSDKDIVVVGVGGAGTAIAKEISRRRPKSIVLIDQEDKRFLLKDFKNVESEWYSSVDSYLEDSALGEHIILINATGADISETNPLDKILSNASGIFIDIRAQLELEPVTLARETFQWRSATGCSMNARNDYVLLQKIATKLNAGILPFSQFQAIVVAAS